MDGALGLLRRQNQKSQPLKTKIATTTTPTAAPIPAFTPSERPWLMKSLRVLLLLAGVARVKLLVVDEGVGVYKFVDVMVTVVPPVPKTTTAVLVASASDADETTAIEDSKTELVNDDDKVVIAEETKVETVGVV